MVLVEHWQLHQMHDKAYENAFEAADCKRHVASGMIVIWHGKVFWKFFQDWGHSSTDFCQCICQEKTS